MRFQFSVRTKLRQFPKCVGNFGKIISAITEDNRVGKSHTTVPGYDGKRGYSGACFPKDTASLNFEMKKSGQVPYILSAVIERNEKVDRPEKELAQ